MNGNSLVNNLIIGAIIVAVMCSIVFLADNLLIYKARQYAEAGAIEDALEYYSRIVNLFPGSSLADDALYEAGEALWQLGSIENQHIAFISSTEEMENFAEGYMPDREVAYKFWEILIRDYPESPLACAAKVRIAEILYSKGQWDKMIEFLQGNLEQYGSLKDYVVRLKAKAYLAMGQPQKVLDMVRRFEEQHSAWIDVVRGDALIALDMFDMAERIYSNIEVPEGDQELREALIARMEKIQHIQQNRPAGKSCLSGWVAVNGRGLRGIKVKVFDSLQGRESAYTYTGENGEYSFSGIPEGVYGVAVEVPDWLLKGKYASVNGPPAVVVEEGNTEQVSFNFTDKIALKLDSRDDTLEFTWDTVPGASRYNIYIGEVVDRKGTDKALFPIYYSVGDNIIIRQEVTKTEQREIYYAKAEECSGNSFTLVHQDMGKYGSPQLGKVFAPPGFILGMPYYGGEFALTVEAVDEKGWILNRSEEKTFAFPSREMPESHQMIKNLRYEGAKALLEGSDNPEDMLLLARLYEAIFKFDDAAQKYMELYSKTGDGKYIVMASLAWEKKGDFYRAIKALEALPQNYRNDQMARLSRLYLWCGEHKKAEESFSKIRDGGEPDRIRLIYYLLEKDLDKALDAAYKLQLPYLRYIAVKAIEKVQQCDGVVFDDIYNTLKWLEKPLANNRDNFVASYTGFKNRYNGQYPYLQCLLYELGRAYWDI